MQSVTPLHLQRIVELRQNLEKMLSERDISDLARLNTILLELESIPISMSIIQQTTIVQTLRTAKKKVVSDSINSKISLLLERWNKFYKSNAVPIEGSSVSIAPASRIVQSNTIEIESNANLNSMLEPMQLKKFRVSVIERLFEILRESTAGSNVTLCARISIEIEAILNSRLNFDQFKEEYKAESRRLIFNLRNNTSCSDQLLTSVISPIEFCSMTDDELANDEIRNSRIEAQRFKELEARTDIPLVHPKDVADGVNVCFKCGSRKIVSKTLQLRGGDEPMTSFFLCVMCHCKWKEG